jgi:peptide/nickel transport system ATP-binding protein
MSDRSPTLSVHDLTKVFTLGSGFSRSRLVAVNMASFAVGADGDEIFTLAGESGSGKTTVANMILGLVEPTAGRIAFRGREVPTHWRRGKSMELMKEIQPVFQNPFETFSPLKKVHSYLYETTLNFGIASRRSEIEQVVQKSLESVGLSLAEIKGKYPNEFSGGQLQRVSVARALITRPSLLVADEPVSMIDASMRMSVVNLFKELKTTWRINILYITHDLATAYYASDRIAIMLRGNIVEMGRVDEVLDEPMHPYTRLLIESVPEPDTDQSWESDIALATYEEQEYAMSGCKFAGRCPHAMAICRRCDPQNHCAGGRLINCYLHYDKAELPEQEG